MQASYQQADGEGALPLHSEKAGDGLWRQDEIDDHNTPPNSKKNSSSNKSCKIVVLVGLLLLLLALRLLALYRSSRWEAPVTWKSCHNNDDDNNNNDDDNEDWTSLLLQSSPCTQRSYDNALCFANSQDFYVWCGGYYYEYSDGTQQWIRLGSNGVLGAVWSDTHDCDELGMEGWKDACLAYGVAEDDLERDDFNYCSMNQWRGFLACGGPNFDYVNGEYILRFYG